MAGRSKSGAAAPAGLPAGVRVLEGRPGAPAGKRRIAIVAARFNSLVTDRLLAGAVAGLVRHGVAAGDIVVARVPGAVEIPLAAKRLAASRRFAAVVALGCVIRGDTTHYDYVCAMASQGVLEASLATGVPVVFGVLTTENLDQALARAGAWPAEGAGNVAAPAAPRGGKPPECDNKGWDAALAALEMADLLGKPELRAGGMRKKEGT